MAKRKISIFETIWYSLCGLVALWGLTYIVLGLIGNYLPINNDDNVLLKASNSIKEIFGLGFLHWGLIILGISAVAAIIVLCVTAKKVDREYEKNLRRQARRLSLNEDAPTADEIIDAEEAK